MRYATLSLLLVVFLFSSCHKDCIQGEGSSIESNLLLDDIHGLHLKIAADIYLTKDTAQSILIQGQSNIIDQITTDVVNGIWTIDAQKCLNYSEPLRIYISMPQLKYVKTSGAGDVIGQNSFDNQVNQLDLIITGAGDITLDAQTTNAVLDISGSGNIDLAAGATSMVSATISGSGKIDLLGSTNNLDAQISGTGSIHAYDLYAQDATVNISGTGHSYVTVFNQLNATISGSGNIYYKGSPIIISSISGVGNIYDRN